MDVALIEMPAEVAKEELKNYRRSLHKRADAEYAQIADGLEALSEGTPLLSLSQVFTAIPRDHKGRPRVAIARADRIRVQYRNWTGSDYADVFNCAYDQRRGAAVRDAHIVVANAQAPRGGGSIYGYALVPIVPPAAREGHDLSRHFILWEVERWADNASEVGPDIDPFLLRRVTDDLYAVVAEWDLSPLEQAILAQRRTR
jgi:hypothetical protein